MDNQIIMRDERLKELDKWTADDWITILAWGSAAIGITIVAPWIWIFVFGVALLIECGKNK